MPAIGQLLIGLREARGISRRELARRAKLPASTLSSYETGQQRPSATALLRIADCLELTEQERLRLLAAIGYPVFPDGSFVGRRTTHGLERTLLDILDAHQLTPDGLAKDLGLSESELDAQLGQFLPSPRLLRDILKRVSPTWLEASRLLTGWTLQAVVLAPWDETKPDWIATSSAAALLALLAVSSGDLVAAREDALGVLDRLKTELRLSTRDLAGVIDANDWEIEEWLNLKSRLPLFAIARATEISRALQVLESLFVSERLADVVRRPAALFSGESALDLIKRGEITGVAEAYDRSLQYVP